MISTDNKKPSFNNFKMKSVILENKLSVKLLSILSQFDRAQTKMKLEIEKGNISEQDAMEHLQKTRNAVGEFSDFVNEYCNASNYTYHQPRKLFKKS